jgi:hypothetical protein
MMRELALVWTLLFAAFGGGYWYGQWTESNHQLAEIQLLNEQARVKEQALATAVNTTANALRTSNEKAKIDTQKLHSALDSGALRLRLKTSCPVPASSDSPIAVGSDVGTTSAELDSETAKRLIAITEDGDKAIRQLNACIDAYSDIYNTLNQKK